MYLRQRYISGVPESFHLTVRVCSVFYLVVATETQKLSKEEEAVASTLCLAVC